MLGTRETRLVRYTKGSPGAAEEALCGSAHDMALDFAPDDRVLEVRGMDRDA